jgi:hypothetical protein
MRQRTTGRDFGMRIANFGLRGKIMKRVWSDSPDTKLKSALRNLKSVIVSGVSALFARRVAADA